MPAWTNWHHDRHAPIVPFTRTGCSEVCGPHGIRHGSDHEALTLHLSIGSERLERALRHKFRKTNWEQVLRELKEWKPPVEQVEHPSEINQAVDELQAKVKQLLNAYTPVVKESPFMKPWWDDELSQLRHAYTQSQN